MIYVKSNVETAYINFILAILPADEIFLLYIFFYFFAVDREKVPVKHVSIKICKAGGKAGS